MTLGVIPFPDFDPTLVRLGPFAIRWYALAYIIGLVIGWRLARRFVRREPVVATVEQVDDFLTWATLGVVVGGRFVYVFIYQLLVIDVLGLGTKPGHSIYYQDPLEIFRVWHGGMSFHGGALGVIVAIVVFCHHNRIPVLGFADRIAMVTPVGLGLGRIANFINGELWGRAAPDWLPWSMVFPTGGPVPRHPSQIYQALLEGGLLLTIMLVLGARETNRARFGFLSGVFLAGYGCVRIVGELFREPDAFLGFFYGGISMGQLLSVPMVLGGGLLIAYSRRRSPALAA